MKTRIVRIQYIVKFFKIGDPRPPISKLLQAHDIIDFITYEKVDFSAEFIEKYQSGHSVSEIANFYGCSKNKVLKTLKRHGINMRPARVLSTGAASRSGSKVSGKLFYGFCYSEGKIVKHPTEFPVLRIIHRLWQQKKSAHSINLELDKRKIKSREGRPWSWAAIQNILKRFENKEIVLLEGGKYELR